MSDIPPTYTFSINHDQYIDILNRLKNLELENEKLKLAVRTNKECDEIYLSNYAQLKQKEQQLKLEKEKKYNISQKRRLYVSEVCDYCKKYNQLNELCKIYGKMCEITKNNRIFIFHNPYNELVVDNIVYTKDNPILSITPDFDLEKYMKLKDEIIKLIISNISRMDMHDIDILYNLMIEKFCLV